MAKNIPPFKISAVGKIVSEEARRGNEYSAMCKADDWFELGYEEIKITDGAGVVRDREEFRKNLPIVKRLQS